MPTAHSIARMVAAAITIVGVNGASGQTRWTGSGQDYPNKPIRIVTSGAGGAPDFVSRQIAQEITIPLGQPVIVDNRAGIIPTEVVYAGQADGYTLLINTNSIWIVPLMGKTFYDPLKDFTPITLAVTSPNVLVVNPAVAANSVQELITLARAKPGALNYASGPSGSANHLPAELFKSMAGVDIVRVPYKSSAPALTDLVAGHVQVMFPNAAAVTPHMKAGKLRALAVASIRPSALLPGLPTVASSGLPRVRGNRRRICAIQDCCSSRPSAESGDRAGAQ